MSGNGKRYDEQFKVDVVNMVKKEGRSVNNVADDLMVASNLVNQNFETDKPNSVWVTDIIYIHTHECCFYFASVKDIFTKEIV